MSKAYLILILHAHIPYVFDKRAGDSIEERIKIVHVGSDEMIVEVESQNFEIKLKGDDDV